MARERVKPFGGGQHQAGVPLPLHLVELHSYAHVLPSTPRPGQAALVNPEFDPIVISGADDGELTVVAELVDVLLDTSAL